MHHIHCLYDNLLLCPMLRKKVLLGLSQKDNIEITSGIGNMVAATVQ